MITGDNINHSFIIFFLFLQLLHSSCVIHAAFNITDVQICAWIIHLFLILMTNSLICDRNTRYD